MQRRKFVIGLGSIAAGGAAAMGTGAFTSATVKDRGFTADITADDVALVGLEPTSPYADISGDEELVLNITDLNEDSDFSFEDLFILRNNGNATLDFAMDLSGSSGVTSAIQAVPTTGGADSSPNLLDDSQPVTLGPGKGVYVGVDLTVGDDNGGPFSGSFTVKTV